MSDLNGFTVVAQTGGRWYSASTLLPKPEEPTDFDPWGGREAPPWTY
jgi:hypothetical protein